MLGYSLTMPEPRKITREEGQLDVDGVPLPAIEQRVRDRILPSVEKGLREHETEIAEAADGQPVAVAAAKLERLAAQIRTAVVHNEPQLGRVDGYDWYLSFEWSPASRELNVVLQVIEPKDPKDLA